MRRLPAVWAVLVLAACEGGSQVVIDLRSDFVAGTEVVTIETRFDAELVATETVSFEDRLAEGRRLAELADVPHGTHDVEVRLRDAAGAEVARRGIRVQVTAPVSVTAVILRSCARLTCPGPGDGAEQTECFDGRCVAPTCTPETPAACPPPTCDACTATSACIEAECIDGACFQVPRHERCGETEWCSAEDGCSPRVDLDGGAPVADAGPQDAGPADAGGIGAPVTSLSAGRDHACAVAGGRVFCWGSNVSGQLGRPEFGVHPPAPVAGIVDAVGVACGIEFSCVLRGSGTVSCWGDGRDFRLGRDGSGDERGEIGDVIDVSRANRVIAGGRLACAFVTGVPTCWGQNGDRQAVFELADDPARPIPHPGAVADQALSDFHACRVLPGGGATECWGRNDVGQLGDGTRTSRATPIRPSGLDSVLTIATTRGHDGADDGATCALQIDGQLLCWGSNSAGQVGDGSTSARLLPQAVASLPRSARVWAGARSFCARTAEGETWCWGQNSWGELGRGTASPIEARAAHAPRLDGYEEIALGFGFGCGITADGGVQCWGNGTQGQVTGRGEVSPILEPVDVLIP